MPATTVTVPCGEGKTGTNFFTWKEAGGHVRGSNTVISDDLFLSYVAQVMHLDFVPLTSPGGLWMPLSAGVSSSQTSLTG